MNIITKLLDNLFNLFKKPFASTKRKETKISWLDYYRPPSY